MPTAGASWDMAGIDLPVRFAGLSGSARSRGFDRQSRRRGEPREVAALSIDDIRITNGAVRYSDERNGAWGRFDGLNAQFSLAAMDQPLTGSGSLVAEGETFEFKSTLTTPQDLAEQRPAKLALTVSGMPLTLQLRRHRRSERRRGHHHRQLALARRAGALVGQRSVAGSRRRRSRLHGAD